MPKSTLISLIVELVLRINEIFLILASVLLFIYGMNLYIWTYLSGMKRKEVEQLLSKVKPLDPSTAPYVTVQLPVYNEKYVAKRLLNYVTNLSYPRDKLEIQVLDDSTDNTYDILKDEVTNLQNQGYDVKLIHRTDRKGYKAGALKEGTKIAKGEFIAIFDADFLPNPDFLERTIPLFVDEDIGVVQARWGYVNKDSSPLTKALSISIDSHFEIEQVARMNAGFFRHFNGTGGVWRKRCIKDAGGWHGDTLAEDLDLSIRAQIKKWRFIVIPEIICPSELPPSWTAIKRQQFRWAKGTIQCSKKHTVNIFRQPIPFWTKMHLFIQMSYYMCHPLMLILLLCSVPLLIVGRGSVILFYLLPLSMFSALAPTFMYFTAVRRVSPHNWKSRFLAYIPMIFIGYGLVVSNTIAVVEALIGKKSAFKRTPKYGLTQQEQSWKKKDYRIRPTKRVVLEVFFGLYALVGIAATFAWGIPHWGSFLVPYFVSLMGSAFLSVTHGIRLQSSSSPHTPNP
ncbi:MAG: glycosyltransferase [Candidatus Hodarchaeota archaeon]